MSDESGFTLIELVMVVVILGILASMTLTRYTGVREYGEESVANAGVAAVSAAAALCYSAQRRKCTFAEITSASYLTVQNVSFAGSTCANVTATSGGSSSTVTLDITQFCTP